jgi:transcriptional regulator with XRE-family HTH domain
MKFHEIFKSLRIERKVTQLEVAQAIGLTDRAMRKYEAGKMEPKMSTLVALADYFDVSLDYLVGRSDEPGMR